MNIILKVTFCLFIFILLLISIRIIIYNNYLNKKEGFTSEIDTKSRALDLTNHLDLKNQTNFLEIIRNANFIYTDILNNIFIVTPSTVFKLNGANISQLPTHEFFKFNKQINIDGGFYNHLNNTLVIFDNDKISVHIYDLKKNKLTAKMNKNDFFRLDKNIRVKGALVFFDNLVIYDEDSNVIIYNLTKEEFERESEYIDIFEQVPDDFTACFTNLLDVHPGIPTGTPTFLRNGDIFTIDLKSFNVLGPRRIENGFLNNTKSSLIKKPSSEMRIQEKSNYRIYLFGAGFKNGGYGGLIFNDMYLKKNDNLDIICGTKGDRIPVRGKELKNALSKVYSINLPYNGSCAGAGGTFLYVNNKLNMVAGGAGGWSSEIAMAPSICDSEKYTVRDNGMSKQKLKVILPIKKIIIITENTKKTKNIRYKINVLEWNAKIYNLDNVDVDINEVPKNTEFYSSEKCKYETAYSNFNEAAQIEFSFSEPITDYKIRLDYEVQSTLNTEFVNSKVIIIDEQYRKYTIDNFNYTFKYKLISAENIMKFMCKNIKINEDEYINRFITDGCNGDSSIKQLIEHIKLHKSYNPNSKEGEVRFMTLKGGAGGGGHSLGDRNSNNIIASGGGGYLGGKTCFFKNYEYSAGCGGTSFIRENNFEGIYKELCENLYTNNANDGDGYVVVQQILPRVEQNIYKKNTLKETENTQENNLNNLNNFNSSFFKNDKVDKLFENKKLKRNKLFDPTDTIINNSSDFEFYETEFASSSNNHIIELSNNTPFKNLCFAVKSNKPFSLFIFGYNTLEYKRFLINKQNKITDDLSSYNHGFSKLKTKKMEEYMMFLMENNIYNHTNQVSFKSLKKLNNGESNLFIKPISDFTDFRIDSIQNENNENTVSSSCNLNKNFDKIFILLQMQEKREEKYIRFVSTKFNKSKNDEQDVLSRLHLYL